MWLQTDFSDQIRQAGIKTPFLVVGGRQDLPGFQEHHLRNTFGEWYAHVNFAFVTDAGHYPMQETPIYLATLIERFLETHRGEGRTSASAVPPPDAEGATITATR